MDDKNPNEQSIISLVSNLVSIIPAFSAMALLLSFMYEMAYFHFVGFRFFALIQLSEILINFGAYSIYLFCFLLFMFFILKGVTSIPMRSKSIDKISKETDYFKKKYIDNEEEVSLEDAERIRYIMKRSIRLSRLITFSYVITVIIGLCFSGFLIHIFLDSKIYTSYFYLIVPLSMIIGYLKVIPDNFSSGFPKIQLYFEVLLSMSLVTAFSMGILFAQSSYENPHYTISMKNDEFPLIRQLNAGAIVKMENGSISMFLNNGTEINRPIDTEDFEKIRYCYYFEVQCEKIDYPP